MQTSGELAIYALGLTDRCGASSGALVDGDRHGFLDKGKRDGAADIAAAVSDECDFALETVINSRRPHV
jgi:hypothetical protein